MLSFEDIHSWELFSSHVMNLCRTWSWCRILSCLSQCVLCWNGLITSSKLSLVISTPWGRKLYPTFLDTSISN